MPRKPLDTGIECYIGRPGSGKSFAMVKRCVNAMCNHRRPVYTNLPLRWRAVRRLLRHHGGESLAGLIHHLSEVHFNRFMQRFVAMREFEEAYKADAVARKLRVRQEEMHAAWIEHAGPDVCVASDDPNDPKPNWIPMGAIVCIDEVHHWFPNPGLKSVAKKEPPELMSYLTMHRHCQHMVWLATQAQRQISQTVWSNAQRIWIIHPRDDDKILGPIRFRHVGVKALGYQVYSREQFELGDDPMRSFSIIPGLPWHQWVFKCYDSFTHIGSLRQLNKQLQAARKADGVDEHGHTETENKSMAWQRTFVGRWFGRIRKFAVLVFVFVLGVAASSMVGTVDEDAADAGELMSQDDPATESPGGLASVGGDRIRMEDGRVLRSGQRNGKWELRYVDENGGRVVWVRDGADVWVQVIGGPARFVGTVSDVVQRFGS